MLEKRFFRFQNSGPRQQWQRERGRHQTKGLMIWIIGLLVRVVSLYFSAKQREMAKYCEVWRTWMTTAKFSWFLLALTVFFPYFAEASSKTLVLFAPGDHQFWSRLFQKTREFEGDMTSYSGLFQVFCFQEQNVWNTFHVFRNWNSVSIERSFGFIPFILIPA